MLIRGVSKGAQSLYSRVAEGLERLGARDKGKFLSVAIHLCSAPDQEWTAWKFAQDCFAHLSPVACSPYNRSGPDAWYSCGFKRVSMNEDECHKFRERQVPLRE